MPEWGAEYDDGSMAHEAKYSSLRNVPDLDRVIALHAGKHALAVPHDAQPIWLRRNSINVMTGERWALTMIGWERGGERETLWINDQGDLVDEPVG